MNEVGSELEGLARTMEHIEENLKSLDHKRKRCEKEAQDAVTSLDLTTKDYGTDRLRLHDQLLSTTKYTQLPEHFDLDIDIAEYDRQMSNASIGVHNAEISAQSAEFHMGPGTKISKLQDQIKGEQENLHQLRSLYAQMLEEEHADSTSWRGVLKQELNRIFAYIPPGRLKVSYKLSLFIKKMVTKGLLTLSVILTGGSQGTMSHDHNQTTVIENLYVDIEKSQSRLQVFKSKAIKILDQGKQATSLAIMIIDQQLKQNTEAQKSCKALRQQIRLKEQDAILKQQQEAILNHQKEVILKQQQEGVMLKQREAATYTSLIESEQSSLHSLGTRYSALARKRDELAADRDLFAFWYSAFAKRTHRASSSSSAKSKTKPTTNFREYILEKSLSELNELLAQILTMLYDDTRHTHAIATGILRSLFDSEAVSPERNTSSSPGPILNRTLTAHQSLAYGKRSGGERKRIDLALFFTLLQLSWARSGHRAQYLLVDEVFDSLDEAGQEAVVTWCTVISQTMVGWVIMVTHSRFLVERDPEKSTDKALVVRVRMGSKGTELVSEGRRIGIQERT
jgi:hypothetical protein